MLMRHVHWIRLLVVLSRYVIVLILTGYRAAPTVAVFLPPPETTCYGGIPKIHEGEYMHLDNGTYKLRFSTTISIHLDVHQQSCFQINVKSEEAANLSARVTSLFYSIEYVQFSQQYPVRHSYQFGIPEFQSSCKCDCPQGDSFCGYEFAGKRCAKGEVCATSNVLNQPSVGCSNEGAATLCCEVAVKPLDDRRFTAIHLGEPIPSAEITIQIYALYQENWALFRSYRRALLPYRGNSLYLNGYENVAEMLIFASAEKISSLAAAKKYYIFENVEPFLLLDNDNVNTLFEKDENKLGWLRYKDGRWDVEGDPLVVLPDIHRPMVTNCKHQQYIDRYRVNAFASVIRNSTGARSTIPMLGFDIKETNPFVQEVRLLREEPAVSVLLASHTPQRSPSLTLDITLHQKLTVTTHLRNSHLDDFSASIALDRLGNCYLNLTLVNAYGQFLVEICREDVESALELALPLITTSIPLTKNYTETMALPAFIASNRIVCVSPERAPNRKLCKLACYRREPVAWFNLKQSFIETQGMCPGCNVETDHSFWRNLDPRKWLNGIGSVSEGLAVAVELGLYAIGLAICIALLRRVIIPLLKICFCTKKDKLNKLNAIY